MAERDNLIELLKSIRDDLGGIKREQSSQGIRLASIDKHMRDLMTSFSQTMRMQHA